VKLKLKPDSVNFSKQFSNAKKKYNSVFEKHSKYWYQVWVTKI